jgi:hypothetical protein
MDYLVSCHDSHHVRGKYRTLTTPYRLLELYSFYLWRSGRGRGRSGGALFKMALLRGTRVRIEFVNVTCVLYVSS